MKYIQGNLLDTDIDNICHGTNCMGGFGSGVAGAIAARWPEIQQEYFEYVREKKPGRHLLGTTQITVVEGGEHIVWNCFTQHKYGGDGAKYASYIAVVDTLRHVAKHIMQLGGDKRIAIPKIGAGLGGLNWDILEELILEIEEETGAEFVVYWI